MSRLIALNPQMQLPQSAPQSYDNQHSILSNIQVSLSRTFADRLESRGILYTILARFVRISKPKESVIDSRIKKTLNYIRHFIRLFKKNTLVTPQQYRCRELPHCSPQI